MVPFFWTNAGDELGIPEARDFPDRARRVSAVSRRRSGLGGPESGLEASLSTPLSTIAEGFAGAGFLTDPMFSIGSVDRLAGFSAGSSLSTEKKKERSWFYKMY